MDAVRFGAIGGTRVILGGHLGIGFGGSGAAKPVAPLQLLYPVVLPSRDQGSTQVVDLTVDLPPAQLEAIEHERDGGPIMFQIHLQGHLLHPSLTDASAGFDNSSFWGDLRYDLPAAQSVEVLEQWGYARSFLIQVPTYGPQDTGPSRLAHRDVEKALAALVDGRYRDAVAACRDALEAAYGQDDSDLFPDLGYQVKNLRTADKDARFWLVRRALWGLTHAAKHNDKTTQAIEWGRRDAVAAVSILSALLQQEQLS